MKIFVLSFIFLVNCFNYVVAQRLDLSRLTQKGKKVYVMVNSWSDESYKDAFLKQLGEEHLWQIKNDPTQVDFLLQITAWYRPQALGVVCDVYAVIFDTKGNFLWRSDIYVGQPTAFNGYDYKTASIKKIIKEGLNKELKRECKKGKPMTVDFTGESKVSSLQYSKAEEYFFEGLEFLDGYDNLTALSSFEKSLKLNPYNSLTYKFKAISLYNRGKYSQAKEAILKSIEFDPLSSSNDSIYLSIMLEKNEKFMKKMHLVNAVSNVMMQFSTSIQTSTATYTSQPTDNYSTSGNFTSKNSSRKMKKVICSNCHGTGVNPTPTHSVSFAGNGEEYCDVCHKFVASGHGYHGDCPSCRGKGYIMKVQ